MISMQPGLLPNRIAALQLDLFPLLRLTAQTPRRLHAYTPTRPRAHTPIRPTQDKQP